jgi:cytochrome c-type biogenesis protein
MASKKSNKDLAQKKAHGLSRAEKIAIPIIIIIVAWTVYSFTQPSPNSSTLQVTYSTTGLLSQSSTAPDFTLPVVGPNGPTGQTITLSSFRGKVVLLEFMEPWCPHCQHMAPILDGLYAQFGAGNVVFITVAGSAGATVNDVASFIHNYGTSWTYVYDSSGTVFGDYGVTSTPTFYIIGKNGSISSLSTGEVSVGELSGAISTAANG